MDTILGHRPATKPAVVVESVAVSDTEEVTEEMDFPPTPQVPDLKVASMAFQFGTLQAVISRYFMTWVCFFYHHLMEIN